MSAAKQSWSEGISGDSVTANTMKRVAEEAGVSLATASRAIRREGYVAPETRERVLRTARRLGYRVNLRAQSLRTRRTYTLAHVFPASYPNPFHAALCHYMERAASGRGYALSQCETRYDPAQERSHFERLVRHGVDGVIVTSVWNCDALEILTSAQVPWCLVERPSDTIPHLGGVLIDHRHGVRQAVEYLLSLGHRRISFLGTEPEQSVERERLEGFSSAMEEAGITGVNEMIHLSLEYSAECGRELVRRILKLPQRPSAIFVASDMIAIGVLQELYAQRIHVPDDISVMNFEDSWGQNMTPPLTCIHMPSEQVAETAVELILERIENPTIPTPCRTVQPKLVVRESTRKVRDS